jgi:lysophospholipase L1-like esterase
VSVPAGSLTTFYAALRELECGSRKSHVRVAWLGDSHAQADFWTGTVRQALQQRFGDAGPGFVHIGFREYRHDGVRVAVHGRWRMRPKKPATTERYQDGNLGLGGLLTAGYAEEPFASLELTDPGLGAQSVGWDVCYKLGQASDELRVGLAGAPAQSVKGGGKLGALRHLMLKGHGLGKLEVTSVNGKPELCGVLIETDPASKAGVVLDNLGLNGARYATALAWDPAFWGAELARRNPELVVLEFGGNEASDVTPRPEDYKRQVQSLMKRIRTVRADVSCLVVGLAERSDKEARIPTIRDAQRDAAAEAGCMFWDTYEVMGGKGSMKRWVDEKKAGEDAIHLLPRGYAELGTKLVADLLAGYQGGCAEKR